jgi:predicted Zn finger-like uncharacterized protein
MRLICPNCSAQYEIDASLIPDEGRDVQCSNCGHTWFELPPAPPAFTDAPAPEEVASEREPQSEAEMDLAGEEAEPEAVEASDVSESEAEAADPTSSEKEAQPEAEDSPQDPGREDEEAPSAAARAIAAASEDVDEDTTEADPFAAAAAAGAALQRRRPADAAALDILREEAEQELAKRRAPPAASLETQTDMQLDEVRKRDTPSRALRARMAREATEESGKKDKKKRQDPRVQSADDGYEAPRRDLLPDIDEINSSLKARKGRGAVDPELEERERRGFRSGFILMVALAIVLIFAYAWAPAIASAVPALEGPLLVYVDLANAVRDGIDGLFGG